MDIISKLKIIKSMNLELLDGDLSMIEESIDNINAEINTLIYECEDELNTFSTKYKKLSDEDKDLVNEYINHMWRKNK